MFASHYWIGSMEAYPGAPQVIQGQPVYQAIAKTNVMPQMQQPIQSNASLPNVIASGYQYTHAGNIVNCSGLNQASYVVQGVDNSNKVLLCIRNPGCANNTLNLNIVPENNQRDQAQNIQITGQGLSNVGIGINTPQKILPNPSLMNPATRGLIAIPEPTHVDLNTHVSVKIGSLRIHVSESFLPWNITNKTILDLEFMKHLFNISGVDVLLTDRKQNETAIKVAVKQLLTSKVLSDWLVLKCEEKEIPFLKMSNQVEIYTASNFTALVNLMTQESCLPLPFISEEDNFIKYLYINFPITGNDKIKKLTLPVFFWSEKEKKRLLCKYPGIRMDCDLENAVRSFTFHIHQSAALVYKSSMIEIRQHIIYRHIIWGFLQMWVQFVKEQFNKCFSLEDIAKSLSLCKSEVSMDGKTRGSDNSLIYDIGYLNCYLKFDPITLRETKSSFSLDNFTTGTVPTLSIIQYYKQFLLINDMHFSDALRNTICFFRNCYYRNTAKPKKYVRIAPSLRSVRILPKNNCSPQIQHGIYLNTFQKIVNNANIPPSVSGAPASRAGAVESDENDVIELEPEQTPILQASAKPLLKTRTVEEINSSVDAIKTTGSINNNINKINNNNMNRNINNYYDDDSDDSDDDSDDNNDRNRKASNENQTSHSEQKEGTRRLNYQAFVSLIQKFMADCYESNNIEISANDESNQKEVIRRRFDEAVRGAISEETLESFIGKIFAHLQLYYTNATCQNILNKMIWRAVEAKYPHLKEEISIKVLKTLEEKSSVADGGPGGKDATLSNGQLNLPVVAHEENDRHKSAPTLSESANSDSEGGVRYDEENEEDATTCSEERGVDPGRAPSPDVIPKKNERKSLNPSRRRGRNGRSMRRSSSPESRSRSKKSKKHDKKRRSKKGGKDLPYRNTLTIVRVSDSPATFRISKKSRIDSSAPSSDEEENERCDTPKNFPTEEAKERCDTPENIPTEEAKERCDTPENIPTEEEKERCDTPEDFPTEEANERCDTPEDIPTEEANERCDTPEDFPTEEGKERCDTPEDFPTEEGKERCETPEDFPIEEANERCETPEDFPIEEANERCETPEDFPIEEANERCETPEDFPIEEANERCETPEDIPIEEANERCDTPGDIPTEEEKERYDTPGDIPTEEEKERCDTPEDFPMESDEILNTYQRPEEQDRSVQTDVPPEEEKSVQTDELPEEQDRYVQTDALPEEQDRAVQTDDIVEEIEMECPPEKEYSEYNLKTCSVVLNANDIEIYIGKGKKRKGGEEDSDSEMECEPGRIGKRQYRDDSDDNDFAPERKRIRRTVSEIQYMEARTRVLQRLRKRKSVYGGYERTRISGEELDSFLVKGSPLSKLNNDDKKGEKSDLEYEEEGESEEELEDEEEMDYEEDQSRWDELKKQYGIKELFVVVTRLEETPEYEKYCLKLLRIEGWNPALEYLTRENFPLNKAIQRKYFELRDGKLYLKKNYQVVDGVIVPADEEDIPLSPKREPESPAREIDFDIDCVKSEGE